ncbi:pentapeptide repeat-containing protein [Methanosarcina mazei]
MLQNQHCYKINIASNLHYANLHYANLHYANLHYANLTSAANLTLMQI